MSRSQYLIWNGASILNIFHNTNSNPFEILLQCKIALCLIPINNSYICTLSMELVL